LHQPRHQDRAGRGRPSILAAVHHKHCPRRALLDRLALRMRAVAEDVDLVEVLACRHVAQGEGLTGHGRRIGTERMNGLDALDAEAALEQRGRNRRGRDGLELVAGGVAEFCHQASSLSSSLALWPEGPGPKSITTAWRYGFSARRYAGARND